VIEVKGLNKYYGLQTISLPLPYSTHKKDIMTDFLNETPLIDRKYTPLLVFSMVRESMSIRDVIAQNPNQRLEQRPCLPYFSGGETDEHVLYCDGCMM
jgi:hypothetical protein